VAKSLGQHKRVVEQGREMTSSTLRRAKRLGWL
jgi:hypothetical protein